MKIRLAAAADLPRILEIYAHARRVMKETGNPNQWKDTYPMPAVLEEDIAKHQLFILEETEIEAVFVFFIGTEPTYADIDGAWLNDLPYGTIHRVASSGRIRGVLQTLVDYCRAICPNLRIDTHEDNRIMQKQVEKAGFIRCGIIRLENGDPRIAYQLP